MKQLKLVKGNGAFVAMIAALALVAFTPVGGGRSTHAGEPGDVNTQTAEILVLLTAVHELTSYNGDAGTRNEHLAAMAQLWAEDATFVVNNATTHSGAHSGRDAIMTFFAGAGFFVNNWVGLSPSFRTEVGIHGSTAEVYLECIFLNESKSVVAERSLSGTVRKVNGQWRFWRMHTNPASPLL